MDFSNKYNGIAARIVSLLQLPRNIDLNNWNKIEYFVEVLYAYCVYTRQYD